MSRKIYGKNRQKQLTEMDITSFGDVERGEKVFALEKLKDTNAVNGEIPFLFANFDTAVNLGKARIVGESSVFLENFDKKQEPEPEPVKEEQKEFSEAVFEEAVIKEEPPAFDEEKIQELLKAEYEKAFNDGYKKGMLEAADNARRHYNKEKDDYIQMLQGTYKEVISKAGAFDSAVKELDSALPEMLTHFLETLIGAERKTNGRLIVSVIKKSLSSLHELSRVVFRVNPDDLNTVLKAFPDYEAVSDPAITQGGLKIDTSIGEMDYTIETMLENFKKLIYEELEST
jgi:flagellar assembly protein FliH